MRCGQTTGMREPMRMISTWSMAVHALQDVLELVVRAA